MLNNQAKDIIEHRARIMLVVLGIQLIIYYWLYGFTISLNKNSQAAFIAVILGTMMGIVYAFYVMFKIKN